MRALVVSPTFFPIVGGAELLIRDVLNVWSERHVVQLLTPQLRSDSEAFWVDDDKLDASCRFQISRFDDRHNLLRMRGHRFTKGLIPPMSLTAIGRIERDAEAMQADVLVGFFGVPYGLPLLMAAKRLRIPLVLVLCGTDLPSPRTAPVPHWRDYLRLATSRADRVVYVSRFCFDVLHNSDFREDHDIVIFGGIDMSVGVDQRAEAAAALRRRLGIAPDDIMLFALQRLGAEKRVDVLVEALAQLPPLDRDVRLVIGGQGPEADALARLADALGVRDKVMFTGFLGDEKYDYYEASDIFTFHSLFETFGQVLVEAMRAGKPIVSVRAGAIPEVVEDGVNGLLATPENAKELAHKIAALAGDDDLRRRMGEASRERAERLFDWDVVRRQWDVVLDVVGAQALSPQYPAAVDINTRSGG